MLGSVHAQGKKTIILVHGAGHGAWCWTKVIPLLKEKGINAVAIDLPGQSLDTATLLSHRFMDDAQAIERMANSFEGKVILAGHSSGGVAIAQAAELLGKEKVEKLIFLDAFMPRNGQAVRDLAEEAIRNSKTAAPDNSVPIMLFTADFSAFRWNPAIVEEHFYHDCNEADKAFAKARLTWQATASNGTPVQVTDGVYGAIPKFFILCTKAKDLDKSSIANNVPVTKLYQLPSSHSPFFSMPARLADLFAEISSQ